MSNSTFKLLGKVVGIGALMVCFVTGTFAQSTNPNDGSTPLALAPGTPAGSYSLSGFESINPFSGNLNFGLPLYSVAGRGQAGYTITKEFQRKWTVDVFYEQFEESFYYFPQSNAWNGIKPGYGPAVLQGRYGGSKTTSTCNRAGGVVDKLYTKSLTRLTFSTADGTEYELRDKVSDGAPATVAICATSGFSRGKVFVTADGTAATFISDTTITDKYLVGEYNPFSPSGYLMLANGTRYRIVNGYVEWIRDRNGNKVSLSYTCSSCGVITQIADSLNRSATPSTGGVSFKGSGGNTRSVQITTASLGTVLRLGYSLQTYDALFPELDGSTVTQYNPTVVSAVTLPNTQQYRFFYNSYGELARVELPTGGAIEYDWAAGLSNGNASGAVNFGPAFGGSINWQIYRRVVERRVYPNGGTGSSYAMRMTFSRPETIDGSLNIQTAGFVTVDQTNSAGTLLSRRKHYYYGAAASSLKVQSGTVYSPWKEGKEYKTETFDTTGATVMHRVEHTWQQPVSGGSWPLTTAETLDSAKVNNPQITQTISTLEPSGANLVSKETFTYDKYLNRTDRYEYGYGAGTPGALIRRTNTTYVTSQTVGGTTYDYACDPATNCSSSAIIGNVIHLRNLLKQVSIYDASGVERARTVTEFDNYASDTNHAPLVNRSAISGLDSSFTTSLVTRGNPTGVTLYLLNTSGGVTGSISNYQQYDIAGSVVKTIDGRGYATNFSYNDSFGAPDGNAQLNSAPTELSSVSQTSYGFATSVTNALGQTSYAQFDYYLGAIVDGQDINGIVSSGYFNDLLDRPTQVRRAVGTAAASQTTFSYDDSLRIVTATSDKDANNDNLLVSKTLYDGLGRTTETRQYEGGTNYIAVQRQYDNLGRQNKVSNPFRPYLSETALWATTVFDGMDRVTSVTTPDNAVVSTAYSGNAVTVTDQAGKLRRSIRDALGRITRVDEPDSSNSLGAISSPNQSTSYSYDVLDNLIGSTQGVQTRTFAYDSLKRLMSTTDPESGTVTYGYDANSNLTSKLNARSITTTIAYDALNRVTSRTYNDSPQTPTLNYYYDAQTLPGGAPAFDRGYSTGRLVAVTYGAGSSAGTYRGYDQMGRIVRQYQRTDSVNYLVEATYRANSALNTQTYPAVPGAGDRRVVTYTNDAAGRLGSLSSSATSYAPAASVSSIAYAAHNALKSETYGNGLIHAVDYNNRLQSTQIKLGTSGSPTSILSLGYTYGTTNNNGNVLTQTYSGGGLSYTQNFGYDPLNRLTTSNENGSNWSQTNAYDRYGNRWIDLGGGVQSLYFNTANNRITGWSYDAVGNLLNDGAHAYAYDAENRIAKVDNVSAYTYDGEGQRVRKLVGENLRFVYGINGQLISEFSGATGNLLKEYVYGASGLLATIEPAVVNANGTRYTTPDHLGTPRVVTNSAAGVISRHDYMPFGVEIGAGVGGRTTGMGFPGASDNLRQKFSSKERDNESGLDYFGARYYGSGQGRFTSADPKMLGIKQVINPQRWNRYSYVVNNPLALYDPDGQDEQGQGGNKVIDVFIALPPDQQQDYGIVNGRRQNLPLPNWSALQESAKKAGYTVNVHQLSESTTEAVSNSMRNSAVTIVIGHGIDSNGFNPNKFTAEGAALSGGQLLPGGTQSLTVATDGTLVATEDPTPTSGAGVVGLFTCNSQDFLAPGFGTQTVVANDGGPDGYTTLGALQQAAFGFVGTYVNTGGNVIAATNSAQQVLNNAANRVVDNVTERDGTRPDNRGDRLHIRAPQP